MDAATPALIILTQALKRFPKRHLATLLDIDQRTIRRWETGGAMPSHYKFAILYFLANPSVVKKSVDDFSFIDLFAGIGGTRLGFEAVGGQCVFTSEWDKSSQLTYTANFNEDEIYGDLRVITKEERFEVINHHDVLLAGFPCQPFSIAGVSKKNSLGRAHGFACEAQGTLFFDVAKVLQAHRPKAFLLENVKNLQSHDKGNTFRVILQTLREELGYDVHYKIIDGKGFVPQHRERIYIVGFREKVGFSWDAFNHPKSNEACLRNILHPENASEEFEEPLYTNKYGESKHRFIKGKRGIVQDYYTLSPKLWNYLKGYKEKHQAKGNGFGYGLFGPDEVARTLSARYYKDGSEILIRGKKGRNPRRLTPRECARLMGFDTATKRFKIPVSDTAAYKQFGNSVVVPVIQEIARIMKPYILDLKESEQMGVRQRSLLA